MQTIEQKRAKHALKQILDEHGEVRDVGEKYKSYVSSLPATILQNGFGQAMAMELAADKGNNGAHKKLYRHIQDWLSNTDNPNAPYKQLENGQPADLITQITSQDQDKYIQAQAEAMAYLEWLKKFAVAFLKAE